jgi:hypothetical protein
MPPASRRSLDAAVRERFVSRTPPRGTPKR